MGQAIYLRQVALVSYGTQFLRGESALAAFAQHGIFAGKRLQFRDEADAGAPADGFALWLGRLADAGAQRLSLYLLAKLPLARQEGAHGRERAVAVHFADRYQIADDPPLVRLVPAPPAPKPQQA